MAMKSLHQPRGQRQYIGTPSTPRLSSRHALALAPLLRVSVSVRVMVRVRVALAPLLLIITTSGHTTF